MKGLGATKAIAVFAEVNTSVATILGDRFASDFQFSYAFEKCCIDPNHCSGFLLSCLLPLSESLLSFYLFSKSDIHQNSTVVLQHCLGYCASLQYFF